MEKKKKGIAVGVVSLIVVFLAAGLFVITASNLKDRIWLFMNVDIVNVSDASEEKQLWQVENEKQVSFYNLDYQETVDKKLQKLIKKEKPTKEAPLYVINPYGSNTCSVNVYFSSEEALKVSYTVSTEGAPDFSQTLYNGSEEDYVTDHAYQVVGLLPGLENQLVLHFENEAGEITDSEPVLITMPEAASSIALKIEEVVNGESKAELSNGLFAMLGHDKAWEANTYLYDNNGWLRGEFPLLEYRSDRLEKVGEYLMFSYSDHDLALMDRLGRIVRKYKFNDFVMHHDYCYDEASDTTFVLVSDKATEKEIVEDVVISIDMESGEITRLLDFKDIFPEMYEIAKEKYPTTTQGENGDPLDWIYFNTIDVVTGENGTDLFLSARELSTVIRINNVFENPEVAYLLSEESVWEETSYKELVWEKKGDFVSQAGQHTVIYMEDDALPEGQYYIAMYNNNFAWAASRPQFDWSVYPGAGAFEGKPEDNSYYYKYLVDENSKSYTLVNAFPVPYSSIVSSVEDMDNGNYVTSSGKSNTFGEYDADGKMIRQYNYDSKKYTYRVFKYDFEDFWFE